jgi:osmotically-inducible protein OsmY
MSTDTLLQNQVMEELNWDPMLHDAQVGISVREGIVTLSGYVDTYAIKAAAEYAVKRVKGVQIVVQEILVRPLDGLSDEEIAKAIIHTFTWHSEIPQDQIQLQVQQGTVILTGKVGWYYQRKAAEQAVKDLNGVKEVSNRIQVESQLANQEVKKKIKEAFKRNALLEAEKITVEMQGSKVILKGKVASWAEKREAEEAAWAVPGVLTIEDELMVAY